MKSRKSGFIGIAQIHGRLGYFPFPSAGLAIFVTVLSLERLSASKLAHFACSWSPGPCVVDKSVATVIVATFDGR
jgi:hypothetical protein